MLRKYKLGGAVVAVKQTLSPTPAVQACESMFSLRHRPTGQSIRGPSKPDSLLEKGSGGRSPGAFRR